MKIITVIAILFIFSSCRWIEAADTPYAMGGGFKIPDGTPLFKQGFRDGCSSLLYARGNGFYRWKHKYSHNPKLQRNPEYKFGFKRGSSFCFNSITPGVVSWDRFIYYHKDDNMMAKNYNDTGLFSGGLGVAGQTSGGLSGVLETFWGTGSKSVMGGNALWAGGSQGQFFGQSKSGKSFSGLTGW